MPVFHGRDVMLQVNLTECGTTNHEHTLEGKHKTPRIKPHNGESQHPGPARDTRAHPVLVQPQPVLLPAVTPLMAIGCGSRICAQQPEWHGRRPPPACPSSPSSWTPHPTLCPRTEFKQDAAVAQSPGPHDKPSGFTPYPAFSLTLPSRILFAFTISMVEVKKVLCS